MFFRKRALAVTISCGLVLGSCSYLAFVDLIKEYIDYGIQGVISRIHLLNLLGMGWPVISPRAYGDFETHRLNFCLWVLLAAISAKVIKAPSASFIYGLCGVVVVATALFISRHEMCNANYSGGTMLLLPAARFSIWIVATNIYAAITSTDWLAGTNSISSHGLDSSALQKVKTTRARPISTLLRNQALVTVLTFSILFCLFIVVFGDGIESCWNIQGFTLEAISKANLINLWPFGEMPKKYQLLTGITYSIFWLALALYVARRLVVFANCLNVRSVLAMTAIVAFFFSDYSRFMADSYFAQGHERIFTAMYELAVFVLLTAVYLATKYLAEDIRTNQW